MRERWLSKNKMIGLLAVLALLTAISVRTYRADTAYGYILPESSSRIYTEEEVADMPAQVLCYAINEIYARGGSMFASGELQAYFSQQYWYTALYQPDQFQEDSLNTYEVQNIAMLRAKLEALGGYETDQPGYSWDLIYSYMQPETDESSGYEVDGDSYIFYDSDKRMLTGDEISALSAKEACYGWAEIYARRGVIFTSAELSEYYSLKNWYWGQVSMDSFDTSTLNVYETANLEALQAQRDAAGGYTLDEPGFTFSGIGSYTNRYAYSDSESQYIFWDSNMRYLTEEEVETLSLQEICYARNEIYARRGYIFPSQELREYFQAKPWYQPQLSAEDFSPSVFNDYEQANADLLARYEYSTSPDGYRPY